MPCTLEAKANPKSKQNKPNQTKNQNTTISSSLEHVVNQDAQAADRKKVPAKVIQETSHEVDTDSDKDESIVATSGSEGSESASEWERLRC